MFSSSLSKPRSIVPLAALLGALAGPALADVPPRSTGGQALVVPDEQLELGEVYHITPGTGTQLIWQAETPLLRVTAVCNRVVGYFVAPFDIQQGQAPLLAGAFRVPVASLRTGLEQYDTQFHGPQALNAAQFPEITFRMTGVTDVQPAGDGQGRQSYALNLAGELTLKDKTVKLSIPMRLTFQPFTWQTMQLGMGDKLILRGRCQVKMAELGLAPRGRPNPDTSAELADLDFYLLCSTMSPERNLFPNISHEQYRRQLRFLTLLRDFDDPQRGYAFGREFMRAVWDDAPALNRLAWATLTEEGIRTRDLAFAFKAAQRANELTGFKDPALLHTLARVYHDKGALEPALKWARKAVEHVADADPEAAAQIPATLQRYEEEARRAQE